MPGRGPSEAERRLFGLMALAEEQQAAVRAALAGLTAERAALQQERAQLAQAAEALRGEAALVRRAAGEVGPGLAQRTEAAVGSAVTASLAGAGVAATAVVEAAVQPVLQRLSGVAAQAGAVEASLRRVVGWASWRLLERGVVVVAALAGLLWLAQLSAWWWNARDLALTQARAAVLKAEIAGLEADRDALVRQGLLAKITQCGSGGGRPCIRVNEAAGAFESGGHTDYRVIQGY